MAIKGVKIGVKPCCLTGLAAVDKFSSLVVSVMIVSPLA